MASLQHIKQGWQTGYRLRVWTGGKRHSVWLGPMREREADVHRRHIEAWMEATKLGTPIPTETQRWRRDLPAELRKRFAPILGAVKTVDEAVDAYIKTQEATNKATTARSKSDTLDQIASHYGSIPLGTLTAELIDTWLQRQNVSPSTIGKHVKHLRTWLHWCVDQHYIDAAPKITQSATIGVGKKEFIELDKITKLLDHFAGDTEMQAVIALSRWCGVRVASELVTLRRSSIDVELERIHIEDAKRSHRQSRGPPVVRVVPLFSGLRPYVMKLLASPGKPSDYLLPTIGGQDAERVGSVLRQRVYRALDELGMDRWPRIFHSLRATRETELKEAVGEKAACDWVGNSKDVFRRHYELVPDETFARAVDV